MQFSTKLVALVATTFMPLLTQAISFTNTFNTITSGQQFTVTWQGDGTPVTISLQNGNGGNGGNNVANLGQSVGGTSSQVTIPNVPSGQYTVEIQQSGQTAFSNQFQINGNGQGPAANNNGINNNINGNNGQCEECQNNNNLAMETYTSTYVSVYGTLTSTYTTTTTGPCTTGTGIAYTSCVPGVTQVLNGVTYSSSCSTYNNGYNPTSCANGGVTSVVNGVTYSPTCSAFTTVINGVTQISDGQVQVGATTTPVYGAGTATTLPPTNTPTHSGTGVQGFFGAAPRLQLSAGAAVLAGGLVAMIVL